MTTRNRGRRSSVRTAPRPARAWFNQSGVPTTISVNSQGALDLLPLGELPDGYGGGCTVRRLIGKVMFFGTIIDTDAYFTWGVTLLTRDALTALALPDPISDLVDWYYHTVGYARENAFAGQTVTTIEYDIRTSRRIAGEDRTLAAIMHVSPASGTSIRFVSYHRMLLQHS